MRKTDKPQGPRIVSNNEAAAISMGKLTPAEIQLIAAHRKMGRDDKTFITDLSISLAKSNPADKRSLFRIIEGGTQ